MSGVLIGCVVDFGMILLVDFVMVFGNLGGGILFDGVVFIIINIVVMDNGLGDFMGMMWGGV